VARYEYSAYGELLRANGPLATANPFRWSTKFWDQESGLIYYGVRYFSSVSGRWISRDPIAEEGGINLYAFIHNNAINGLDAIGKLTTFEQEVMADVYADEAQAAKFIAQRGETIITRVQQAANAHAQGQSLSVTIMDSAEGDATELLNLFTRINNEGFGAALRGSRTVRAVGEEWHHIFPRAQEFARYFKEANINIERFQIGLQRMYHQGRALSLHARGFGGRGGLWNAAWRDFFGRDGFRALAGNQAAQEEAILKFGSQMFQFFVGI
jgi:RHS repeat-associated protein